MLSRKFQTVLVMALAGLLTACGGGGSGGTASSGNTVGGDGDDTPPPAPSFSTVNSSGIITGFGSVFINGVKYEVENGTIVAIEDETQTTGDDSILRLGMKVRINAREDDNGQRFADRIDFDEDLKGPVSAVTPDATDPSIGTFTILGQTVTVDTNTILDDNIGDNNTDGAIDINDLLPGTGTLVAEVSGFPVATGLLATRVERLNPVGGPAININEVEIKGAITDVTALPVSFELNGNLTVNIGGATFESDLASSADLVLNRYVEVKGTRVNDAEINAVRLQREDSIGTEQREGEFEIEGVIISVDTLSSPHVVVINGITLQLTDATNLSGLVGKRVELKGTFSGDLFVPRTGAEGIKTEVENTIRTEDLLVSVDTTTNNLNTRLGLNVIATGLSRVEDESRDIDRLQLTEFINGLQGKGTASGVPMTIEARAYPDNGSVIWTRIEVDSISQGIGVECRLRGPISSFDATAFSFVIQGVTVDASGVLDSPVVYRDQRSTPAVSLSREDFFARLETGIVVNAVGNKEKAASTPDCTTLNLVADEVELGEDDGVFGTVRGSDDNGGTPGGANELVGAATDIDNTGLTFRLAGQTVVVNANTLIDDSIIEAARGVEIANDLTFGSLPETLTQLLQNRIIKVTVTTSGDTRTATEIEDVD